MEPLTITVSEAARRLGISRQHAHDLIRRGQFPIHLIRVGGRWRVPTGSLMRLVEAKDA